MIFLNPVFAGNCIQYSKSGNELTFYYVKNAEDDKPFFYAKLLMEDETDNSTMSISWIRSLKNHLYYLPSSHPKKYRLPDGVKKLYVVKSYTSRNDFNNQSRIVPSVQMKTKKNHSIRNIRGGNNHPKRLPKETFRDNIEKNYNDWLCGYTL